MESAERALDDADQVAAIVTTASKKSPSRRSRALENDPLQLLSPEQTAQLLCCSRSTVDRMVADGILPHVPLRRGKRKKQYAIRRESLRRWIERNETGSTNA